MAQQESSFPVKSVATSFRIIEELQELEWSGASELADRLDLPISTIHDHLQTLTQLELLVRKDGKYRVSLRFLDYGGAVRKQTALYPAAWREVQKLALETGEHANLMIEEFGKGRYIYIAEGENSAKLDTYTGMEVHLHTTAIGKSILAHLPNERINAIVNEHGLSKLTEKTISDKDDLFEEISTARERGHTINDEERTLGVRCVGAPIKGPDREVYGGVSVSGPTSRFVGDRLETELPEKVKRTANVIELNIANS
jgi:DNA-binding IclR family transcriptional regulator